MPYESDKIHHTVSDHGVLYMVLTEEQYQKYPEALLEHPPEHWGEEFNLYFIYSDCFSVAWNLWNAIRRG